MVSPERSQLREKKAIGAHTEMTELLEVAKILKQCSIKSFQEQLGTHSKHMEDPGEEVEGVTEPDEH